MVITIFNKEEKYNKELNGKYDFKEEYLWMEDKTLEKIEMTMDFKRQILKRKTPTFLLTIPLNLNEKTKATMELLEHQQTLILTIETIYYKYKNRVLQVKYRIIESDETVEYKIEF